MKKSESLQALRGIAFLGIFFIHSHFIINWSGIAVSVFFVISGFLCEKRYGGTFAKTEVKQCFFFAWARIRKIYPLHILLMLHWAALVLLADFSLRSLAATAGKMLLNITLTQSWIPDSTINVCLNGVAWFLSSITAHYFVFPAADTLLRREKSMRKPLIILLFMLLAQVIACWILKIVFPVSTEVYVWFMYTFPVFRFVDFYAGMCLGRLSSNMQSDSRITFRRTVLELGALLLTVLLYRSTEWPRLGKFHTAIYNGSTIYILPAAMWVWLFYRKKGLVTRLLSLKPFVFLGDLSPYLFLIHFPVTQFDGWLLKLTDNTFIITAAELVLSILLAMAYAGAEPCISDILRKISCKRGTVK